MVHRLFLVTMLEFAIGFATLLLSYCLMNHFAPESVLQMCFGSSFVFNAKQIMSAMLVGWA